MLGAVAAPAAGGRTTRRGARRFCAALAGACLLPAATGCYSYRQPRAGELAPGSAVALGITDRGRVALGDQLGPGILRIKGQLVQRTDSTFVLRVSAIEHLNGRTSKWSGEQVVVSRDHVGTAAEQHFSRGRTWLAVSGVAVGVALAATAVTLNTSGREGGGGKLPPGGGTDQ